MNKNGSLIKTKYPEDYVFFRDFYLFTKKYWNVSTDETWWNCFLSDLEGIVNEYDQSDLFVNLLMLMFYRAKDEIVVITPFEAVSKFYSEWWEYVNAYYEISDDDSWWEAFDEDSSNLRRKYHTVDFFRGCIDVFANHHHDIKLRRSFIDTIEED